MESFEVRSRISAPPTVVWQRVTTPAGINDELAPVMRMTMPASMRGRTIADLTAGTHVGRSWLLLLGVVPFDYDDLSIAELEPGRFLERSTMLSMRVWEHERTITAAAADGCMVTDRISFELRRALAWLPGLPGLLRALLQGFFHHRHRRLARYFSAE